MMIELRQWIGSVLTAALLISMLRGVLPKGRCSEAAAFTGGLVLLCCILSPALGLRLEKIPDSRWREQLQEQRMILEADRSESLAACIAEETSAYIWKQGQDLSVDVRAEVETAAGQDGIPVPFRVTLYGRYSPELSSCIEKNLGIPAERQVWNEGKT